MAMSNQVERYIPEGMTEHRREGGRVVYYGEWGNSSDRPRLRGMAFRSDKVIKPDFDFTYRSEEERDEYVDSWWRRQENLAASKEDRKQEKRVLADQPNPFKVEDILYSSWGYEQTNIDFYKVVEVKGKSVVIVKVGKKEAEGMPAAHMSGYVVAVPGVEVGERMLKRVTWSGADNPVLSLTSYSSAYRWDGKPKNYTTYA